MFGLVKMEIIVCHETWSHIEFIMAMSTGLNFRNNTGIFILIQFIF